MNIRMFAVQDIPAGCFHGPFLAQTEGVACRLISDAVRREGHAYNMHPGDYLLYEVGEFDEVSGMIIPVSLRRICSLSSFVQTQEG